MSSESGVPTSGLFSPSIFLRKIAINTKTDRVWSVAALCGCAKSGEARITCVGTAKDVVRGSAHMFWKSLPFTDVSDKLFRRKSECCYHQS
jgi:hypothetical protein